jgi:hypothetical protein
MSFHIMCIKLYNVLRNQVDHNTILGKCHEFQRKIGKNNEKLI